MKSGRLRGAVLTAALCAAIPAALVEGVASGASHATVSISSFAFHPKTLRVSRGTVLTVVNRDPTTHTMTSSGHFNTGHIRPHHSVSFRLGSRGTFRYHCSIHPFMTGTIVVH